MDAETAAFVAREQQTPRILERANLGPPHGCTQPELDAASKVCAPFGVHASAPIDGTSLLDLAADPEVILGGPVPALEEAGNQWPLDKGDHEVFEAELFLATIFGAWQQFTAAAVHRRALAVERLKRAQAMPAPGVVVSLERRPRPSPKRLGRTVRTLAPGDASPQPAKRTTSPASRRRSSFVVHALLREYLAEQGLSELEHAFERAKVTDMEAIGWYHADQLAALLEKHGAAEFPPHVYKKLVVFAKAKVAAAAKVAALKAGEPDGLQEKAGDLLRELGAAGVHTGDSDAETIHYGSEGSGVPHVDALLRRVPEGERVEVLNSGLALFSLKAEATRAEAEESLESEFTERSFSVAACRPDGAGARPARLLMRALVKLPKPDEAAGMQLPLEAGAPSVAGGMSGARNVADAFVNSLLSSSQKPLAPQDVVMQQRLLNVYKDPAARRALEGCVDSQLTQADDPKPFVECVEAAQAAFPSIVELLHTSGVKAPAGALSSQALAQAGVSAVRAVDVASVAAHALLVQQLIPAKLAEARLYANVAPKLQQDSSTLHRLVKAAWFGLWIGNSTDTSQFTLTETLAQPSAKDVASVLGKSCSEEDAARLIAQTLPAMTMAIAYSFPTDSSVVVTSNMIQALVTADATLLGIKRIFIPFLQKYRSQFDAFQSGCGVLPSYEKAWRSAKKQESVQAYIRSLTDKAANAGAEDPADKRADKLEAALKASDEALKVLQGQVADLKKQRPTVPPAQPKPSAAEAAAAAAEADEKAAKKAAKKERQRAAREAKKAAAADEEAAADDEADAASEAAAEPAGRASEGRGKGGSKGRGRG